MPEPLQCSVSSQLHTANDHTHIQHTITPHTRTTVQLELIHIHAKHYNNISMPTIFPHYRVI